VTVPLWRRTGGREAAAPATTAGEEDG